MAARIDSEEPSPSSTFLLAGVAVLVALLCHLAPWVQVTIGNAPRLGDDFPWGSAGSGTQTVTGMGFKSVYGIVSGAFLGAALLVFVIPFISKPSHSGLRNAAMILAGLAIGAMIAQLALYAELGTKRPEFPPVVVVASPLWGLFLAQVLSLAATCCGGFDFLSGSKRKKPLPVAKSSPTVAGPGPDFSGLNES